MNTAALKIILLICIAVGIFALYVFNADAPISEVPVTPPENAVFMDASQSPEARAWDLLSYMTLEEKVGQMALVEKNSVHDKEDIGRFGIGSLLSGQGAKPDDNSVDGWSSMVEGFMDEAEKSRLGIPLLYGVDAIHGHTNVPGATIFPHAIGLGASDDEVLVEKIARATALELAATNIYWNYAPNLDLPEDIRWGRTFEGFSSDAQRAAHLGAAFVRGMHGTASQEVFVMSTPKHYIGAGGMVWGSSSNPNFRIDMGTTPAGEINLRKHYLPPFAATVEAGALSILVGLNAWADSNTQPEDLVTDDLLKEEWGFSGAWVNKINAWAHELYKDLNGVQETKLAANEYLVTQVLKEELGFDGFAVSDWYGVYEIEGGDYAASVTAINAGIDMVMLPFDYKTFIKNVVEAVERGDIKQERIDDAVHRILRAKFALGLFEKKTDVQSSVVGSDEHKALAREAVARSLVLLKNEEAVLPISNTIQRIHIAGSAADNVGMQSGGWTLEWQGVDGNWLPGGTSILAGIKERAGEQVEIEYNASGTFTTTEEKADVGIAIVGEKPYAEGWGDRAIPTLDSADLKVIDRLKESSEKVVVVIVSGRPLLITGDLPQWDAVVAAWLPGGEGAGVADVLFGDVPFTGTLPLHWPAYSQQLPVAHNGQTVDGTSVLFDRGYGLTY